MLGCVVIIYAIEFLVSDLSNYTAYLDLSISNRTAKYGKIKKYVRIDSFMNQPEY